MKPSEPAPTGSIADMFCPVSPHHELEALQSDSQGLNTVPFPVDGTPVRFRPQTEADYTPLPDLVIFVGWHVTDPAEALHAHQCLQSLSTRRLSWW